MDQEKLMVVMKEAYPSASQEELDHCCHLCCCVCDAHFMPSDLKGGPIDRLTDAIKKLIENKDNILEAIELIMLLISMFAAKKEADNA